MSNDNDTPSPDAHGFFEPKVGRAPDEWPWALHVHYAVNFGAEPRSVPVAASATPEGAASIEEHEIVGGRVELVGFWRGTYAVVRTSLVRSVDEARHIAEQAFDGLRIRFLLERGTTVRSNDAVEVTGTWPRTWPFDRMSDLGVCCAFVYEQARARGAKEAAEAFKAAITFASPPTEQLIVYLEALEGGQRTLGSFLDADAQRALDEATTAARRWLWRKRE